MTNKMVRIPTNTIEAIIDEYTREAGVPNLDRTLAAVIRATAAKIAEQLDEKPASSRGAKRPSENGSPNGTPETTASNAAAPIESPSPFRPSGVVGRVASLLPQITVHPADLLKILGPSRFESELAQRTATPGVVTGLAYTPVGGEILFIEATQMPGKGSLQLTGQIGEVMKESVQAAFSLLKHNAKHLGIDPALFAQTDVHVHVPAGAIPKDGPSAGIAMYTALASLFLNKPVRPDLAMTGEVTLRGLVLPIGGVKEKVIAAQRAGIKSVILPQRNEKNLIEISEDTRKHLKFHFASNVDQVLKIALAGKPAPTNGRPGPKRPQKEFQQ